MKLANFLIDAFTGNPFAGNPTAVCLHNEDANSKVMQSIATELNYPVTAFVNLSTEKKNYYEIRYFTSITEINACGHATLAAAKLMLEEQHESSAVHFSTISNTVIKTFSTGQHVMMIYPAYQQEACEVDDKLLAALDLDGYKTAMYSKDLETLFIEINSVNELTRIKPDHKKLLASSDTIQEVVITSVSNNSKYDYYLRSFCPWIGIDEDPVTGSVQSILGNFWKRKLGKENLRAFQASARGGELVINAFDDRVEIGGEAVIIMRGEIVI